MSPAWQDERPVHGIVYMGGCRLTCTCGLIIELTGADINLSQRIRYDVLLDRHSVHRSKQVRRP